MRRLPMHTELKPEMSCVPYRRKGLYFAVTIPLLAVLIAVFVHLWTYSVALSLVFLSLYAAICYFQAYCCAYQECPYVGGFCPAIVGIYPANMLAKLIYGRKNIVKTKKRFEVYATLAVVAWLGMVIFPLFWIAKLGILVAVGYVASHVVYYLVFGLTVCPACAIRHTCPGGKLQSVVLNR
jgi:hypothetical protein